MLRALRNIRRLVRIADGKLIVQLVGAEGEAIRIDHLHVDEQSPPPNAEAAHLHGLQRHCGLIEY